MILDLIEAIADAIMYATWSPPWSRARRAERRRRT